MISIVLLLLTSEQITLLINSPLLQYTKITHTVKQRFNKGERNLPVTDSFLTMDNGTKTDAGMRNEPH